MVLRVIYAVTEAVQRGRGGGGGGIILGGRQGEEELWGAEDDVTAEESELLPACPSLRVHFTNPPELSGLTCVRAL